MSDLIYKDLSYKIVGVLFKVHNKLGTKYQEKYYHLKEKNLSVYPMKEKILGDIL